MITNWREFCTISITSFDKIIIIFPLKIQCSLIIWIDDNIQIIFEKERVNKISLYNLLYNNTVRDIEQIDEDKSLSKSFSLIIFFSKV
jgi:hypothetical protein